LSFLNFTTIASFEKPDFSDKLLEQHDEAIADYTRVIQLEPSHNRAYFNRGLIFATINKDEQALADFARVAQANPEDGQAHFYLGMIHYNHGHLREALPHLERAGLLGVSQANELASHIRNTLIG
jgi:tetratricopeptide (TPR) repeat protein